MLVFGSGMMLFFLGAGILYYSEQVFDGSLARELQALTGLVLGGIGFLTVLTAQICFVMQRIR